MSLSADDAFFLYETIFKDELHALIRADEHGKYILNYHERRIIRNNHESMAKYAAHYYIDNYGINLFVEELVQEAINETIEETLRHFR